MVIPRTSRNDRMPSDTAASSSSKHTQMLTQLIDKHGARQTAKMLINARIKNETYGLVTISDLSDTHDLCILIDELEYALSGELINEGDIRDILSNINEDFLTANIYS